MSIYKKILCAFIFILLTGNVLAQSSSENGNSPSTNSPYTRYGFGQLSDQSFGNSKAMGGVAYGLRDGFADKSGESCFLHCHRLTYISV